MARRSGKAASRRERQRRAQRAANAASSPQAPTTGPSTGTPTGSPAEPSSGAAADSSTAFDQADAALRASVPPPGSRPEGSGPQRSVRARTSDFVLTAGSSRLSERAVSEYHYVVRDLRNIGILMVVMVVLLAVAVVVAGMLGVGQG